MLYFLIKYSWFIYFLFYKIFDGKEEKKNIRLLKIENLKFGVFFEVKKLFI